MIRYYREGHRPWYHRALPWLSPTHRRIEELHLANLHLTTASTDAIDREHPHRHMWEMKYLQHNAAVRQVVPVGEGWERLCSFLGHPVPPPSWPHENRAGSK